MAIMLTPDQIPTFWEAIKFAAVNADLVEEEYRERYLNKLLYSLLSNKAQCFVRLSEDRKLQMVVITAVMADPLRDDSTLYMLSLYSFEKVDKDLWLADLETLREFGKSMGCSTVTTMVTNDRAAGLCEKVGMKLRFRSYTVDIGGA